MNTTVRSLDDAKTKRYLLDAYIAECDRIEYYAKTDFEFDKNEADEVKKWGITKQERLEVFERRREKLYNALVNVGIKIQAEASDTLPSIARALAETPNT